MTEPMDRSAEGLKRARVVHLAEVGSTSAEGLRFALAGETLPLWVLADRQTAGRGRAGRAWTSLPGNLNASLVMALGCAPQTAAQLSFVAGVAVIDAIRALIPRDSWSRVRLKWPNDVLLDGGKAGGLLIETTRLADWARAPGTLCAVTGIGLNLAAAPSIGDYETACLSALAPMPGPGAFLSVLDAAISDWLAVWDNGSGFERVRAAWLERAGPAGEAMRVHTEAGTAEGTFAGVDHDGALLLKVPTGAIRRFSFGDVVLLTRHDQPDQRGASA